MSNQKESHRLVTVTNRQTKEKLEISRDILEKIDALDSGRHTIITTKLGETVELEEPYGLVIAGLEGRKV